MRNGQDREEIWVAFKGIIYEVTHSRHWRNGIHYKHWAGQDLTPELADAPHGDYVFKPMKKQRYGLIDLADEIGVGIMSKWDQL